MMIKSGSPSSIPTVTAPMKATTCGRFRDMLTLR
jgi:hypothetical protein